MPTPVRSRLSLAVVVAIALASVSLVAIGGASASSRSTTKAAALPSLGPNDLVTVYLTGSGGIDHVDNETGAAVNSSNQVTNVVDYP